MIRGPKSGPIQALRPVPVPEPPRWLSTVERLSALRDAGPRIPTGFANLDAVLHGGLRSGKLFCISGGPSAWKTSVCVQLGDHFAEQGAAVLWIAFDECAESIDSRRLQARGVPRLETEQPTERTMRVAAELDTLPFHVVEPQPTEDAIEAFSEKYPQRLRVVFIDSIQGSYTRNSDRFDSRRDKVDDAVRTLRRYAATPNGARPNAS
jgi:predicted ATP-dependent serine protease